MADAVKVMPPERITDDLDRLLQLLPDEVQRALAADECRRELLEVFLDLGSLGQEPMFKYKITKVAIPQQNKTIPRQPTLRSYLKKKR